jgi:hypothetical protein
MFSNLDAFIAQHFVVVRERFNHSKECLWAILVVSYRHEEMNEMRQPCISYKVDLHGIIRFATRCGLHFGWVSNTTSTAQHAMGGANHDLKPFVASAFVAMVEKGHHPAEVNQTISMLAKDFLL